MSSPSAPLIPPPAPQLNSIELRTAQWEELLAWYRDVLRLPVRIRIPEDGYALLGMGGCQLALLRRPSEEVTPAGPMNLVLETPDLPALSRWLDAARQQPQRPLWQHPEGYWELVVRDPAGNRVRLIQFPGKCTE